MKKFYLPDSLQNQQSKLSNQSEIQISIDRYTLVQEVVIYYVRIQKINQNQQWTFKTRYKELRNVHNALIQAKIKNLPQFPKKKFFGNTNQNPEDIEKRREELQKYLREIFSNKQVVINEALIYFLEQSKKQAVKDKQLQEIKKLAKQR